MNESISKYRRATEQVFAEHSERDKAASLAVGGNYEALGEISVQLLMMQGLKDDMFYVDVGAGSGRCAFALKQSGWKGTYLGTDISQPLLDYAGTKVTDVAFRFERVDGFVIPAPTHSADMVGFFSVFTHLMHEESFLYLQEAIRVLKPGGRVVISYLDFAVRAHWPIFDATVASVHQLRPHNIFMSSALLDCWQEELGLLRIFQQDGGIPFIPLRRPVTFDHNNTTISGKAALGPVGQSVVVFQTPVS